MFKGGSGGTALDDTRCGIKRDEDPQRAVGKIRFAKLDIRLEKRPYVFENVKKE